MSNNASSYTPANANISLESGREGHVPSPPESHHPVAQYREMTADREALQHDLLDELATAAPAAIGFAVVEGASAIHVAAELVGHVVADHAGHAIAHGVTHGTSAVAEGIGHLSQELAAVGREIGQALHAGGFAPLHEHGADIGHTDVHDPSELAPSAPVHPGADIHDSHALGAHEPAGGHGHSDADDGHCGD